MQREYTKKAEQVLKSALKYAKKLKQNYIGSEHILLGLLEDNAGVAAKILMDNGVTKEKLIELIKELIAPVSSDIQIESDGYSPRAEAVLEEAYNQCMLLKNDKIGTQHLLLAIIKEGDSVAIRLLNTLGINIQKIYTDIVSTVDGDVKALKEDLAKKNSKRKKEVSFLEQYSRDLTKYAREGKLDPVVGREVEIRRVIQILSRRTKNNPCLVGEPGVGKTAIAEGLAQRIVSGDVPQTVKEKRVLTLDLAGMVAGSKYRGEFEDRIKKVIKEVKEDGDILLFLDEIHTLIGAGGAEGAIDAANILKPSLSRGEIQLIGATTIAEYRKHIEKDAALERRFQPITIEEPTIEEAIRILKGIVPRYEAHHNVMIGEGAIEAAVRLSSRYINDRNLPDKAIDLIDEAAASMRLEGLKMPDSVLLLADEIKAIDLQIEQSIKLEAFSKAGELKKEQEDLVKKYNRLMSQYEKKQKDNRASITEEDIAKIVSDWTKIPVSKLAQKESEKLLKLEKILGNRVVGQKEGVAGIAKAMRRGRVGLQDPRRPIGSFLFLGPTGVGKTELSKALAEAMFGSEQALIRVDMSEFMEGHSVSKMIGSPPGYVGFDEGGQLSDKVRRNPYSVVLFDEIEKAHPDVFNVLLQVLDDGHITDSKGRKVSFKNTILIMTSNAGANRIVEPKNLGFSSGNSAEKDYQKMKENVMEEVKKMFKPEFINRIDEIMVFHPLTKEDMKEIITLLSQTLIKRCKEQLDIQLTITPALKMYLVDKYMDLKMGARPLKRAIQSTIEDALAEEILMKKIVPGNIVTAGIKDNKVIFKIKEE
ncbi:MAG: ATP-dependent Clp protease ATP-binding subunit [Lachnospiraceae bacterium]